MGRGQPFPPIGQPLPGPKSNRMTWAGPLSMLARKNIGGDVKLSSPSSTSFTSGDVKQKTSDPDLSSPPTLPPRSATPAHSPSLDDLTKGSSLPRLVPKPKLPPRRRNRQNGNLHNHGYDGTADGEGILVLKAPDTDGDVDSLASFPSESGDANGKLEGLGLDIAPLNDLSDEPMGDMEGVLADGATSLPTASKSSTSRTPPPILTSSHIPLHDSRPNTPAAIASPASSTSSIPRSATESGTSHKKRSRQSLIPTPSSSRKHSPSERAYKDVSRRTSMQDLSRRTDEGENSVDKNRY